MNWAGFTIALVSIAIVALIFVFNKKLEVITKYYWFWLVIGIFLIIWYLVWRWIPDIKKYTDLLHTSFDPSTPDNSDIISRAFLLDACPFFSILLAISLIVDPSRKLARTVAPFAFLGGIFVLFGQIPFNDSITWGFKDFFIGSDSARLYVFAHFASFVLSFMIILNTPKYGWKGYVAVVSLAIVFYSYVLIVMKTTGCRHSCAGMSLDEWEKDGPYYFVKRLTNLPTLACMIIGLTGIFLLGSGYVAFNDYVIHVFRKFNYGNFRTKKFYIWYQPNIHTKQ